MSPTKTDTRPKPQGRPTAPQGRPTAPQVDPRIRQRRAAIARRKGRRRLRIVLLAAVVVLLLIGGWFLLHSRVLAARVVTVVGSVHTPPAQVISVAGLSNHPPMIDVDPAAAAARLEQLPWVSKATVSRLWPDGVRITVVEHSAAAVAATTSPAAEPWALVDRSGRVLADVATPPSGLVRLVTPDVPGPPGSDMGTAAATGLTVAASLPKAFSAQVTSVEVSQGGQVTLTMTTPVTIVLGSTTQLHQKYEDAAALLAGAKLVAGDVIDVSVPDSPTVSEG